MSHTRMMFTNLPVTNLEATKRFFAGLGFTFEPRMTDENAACMIVNDSCNVMLLTREFFSGFTQREIAPKSCTEALLAISCSSREDVDALAETALQTGGKTAMPPMDHGFMYGRSFYDLDDHHWEVFWMDPEAAPAE